MTQRLDPHKTSTLTATVGALGVVFGDIGTSPLYALRECFHNSHGLPPDPANILGIISLIIWSLVIVVTLKYLLFVMRADNRGEGGILALMALAQSERDRSPNYKLTLVMMLGIFGASLLFGDGMITPAISVLSAVEGLEIATPLFKPFVVPITIFILAALFFVQKHGTAAMGKAFGPIMIVWFAVLGILGLNSIFQSPQILFAINPWHAAAFFAQHAGQAFMVLGSVFLVVTGGEALYADMGHFGRIPIQRGWFFAAFPALLLQYLGQGGLILRNPAAISNPFYLMAPDWALYGLVVLATLATVIASQALLTGAFSLAHQAVQLNFLPHLVIRQTSAKEIGQIYVPFINWLLFAGTIGLVLEFQSSGGLAAAYGLAVTGTMLTTTLLTYIVACNVWKWSAMTAGGVAGFFLIFDLAFFGANLLKVPQGGWLPLVIGGLVYFMMITWKRGRAILATRTGSQEALLAFIERTKGDERVDGKAIFFTETPEFAPPALSQNLRHNKILHKENILLTIRTLDVPYVEGSKRIEITPLQHGFSKMSANYGFMETPDVEKLCASKTAGSLSLAGATFFMSQFSVHATENPGMALWREQIFSFMSRNSQRSATFFNVPARQVIQLGGVVDI